MIIYMQTVENKANWRELSEPLPLKNVYGMQEYIPPGFQWNGSSVPIGFNAVFPRHRHPIASCRPDWRCAHARCAAERAYADRQFEKDVGKSSWWITKKLGYAGVRIGAFFGVGSNF